MNSYILILIFTWSVGVLAQEDPVIIDIPDGFNMLMLNSFLDTRTLGLNDKSKNFERSECKRTCVPGKRRICYQKFTVEAYQAMGAACLKCAQGVLADCYKPQCLPLDGIEKGVTTINRQIPGPAIEVCEKDLIVIDVVNQLHSDSISIHWHGVLQRGTQYMDGVPYVTQCPISPDSTFRYKFFADEAGTLFYHSHSGTQRNNGVFGALIIRKPKSIEPESSLYDVDDHTMVLADWSHDAPEMFVTGLPTRPPGLIPEASLINGRGRFLNSSSNVFTPSPYETFYVKQGLRHRFRIISAASSVCPTRIQIQGHKMQVIALDGNPVAPVMVDSLVVATGERFDVVVTGNQKPGMYWIHTRLVGACPLFYRVFQSAVLSYQAPTSTLGLIPPTVPTYEGYPQGVILNDIVTTCKTTPGNLCLAELKAPQEPRLNSLTPTHKFYFTFTMKRWNHTRFFGSKSYNPFIELRGYDIFIGTVNGLSFKNPSSPLLSQPNDVDQSSFCEAGKTPSYCKDLEVCLCTQVVNIKQNAVVDIVLLDGAEAPTLVVHPIHFHGLKFSVLDQGNFPNITGALTVEKFKAFEAQGLIKPSNPEPPVKDTIAVQYKGYAVIRFKADNPGQWLVHCHVEDHMIYGMSFILNVGGNVPLPPQNFPKCGNFY